MPFKNFSDFTYIPGKNLLPTDYLVGYREFNNEYRTKISDLTIELLKNLDLNVAPEVLYVSPAGDDTNSGKSEFNAFKTIKRACAKALEISRLGANSIIENQVDNDGTKLWGVASKSVNIFIKTGTYIEDNPIYLPPKCTLIGDNLRSTNIIPKNKFYDIIWVNHGCYVWGFTFRRHKSPSYAIAYPELRFLDNQPEVRYPSTRMQTASSTATTWFTLCGAPEYDATRLNSENPSDLSDDFGDPIYSPAQIAFLGRYFQNLNDIFYTENELIENVNFDQTQWYANNVKKAYTLTSPYPQGCSSITQSTDPYADNAGGGVLVDGYSVNGPTRSMVMDSFTQFNEGGKGIHIINNGYAQLVSTFTICCTDGVLCESGGTCSINTSNCSFGLRGLVAYGISPKPTLIGTLAAPISGLTNIMHIQSLSGEASPIGNLSQLQEFHNDYQPYPGQIFQIVFTDFPSMTATNDGNFFSMLSCTKVRPSLIDGNGFTCDVILDGNYTPFLDTSLSATESFDPPYTIPKGSLVYFYIRSTVTSSAHTLEYIGTGTTLLSAIPQKGGQTDVSTEVVFDTLGRVYFTSTNQFGDFRIGTDLTIVQATGTIEGETFERSILTIVTPFTIAIAATL